MPVAKGATLDPAQTRAAMIDAASRLLYMRGLDGIGVAELCATVGVSKETLYRHFGSKDGLVAAVLQARSEQLVAGLREAVAAAGDDPAAQLTAVFEVVGRRHAEATFRGCAVMNAATQRHDGPARAVATGHLDRYLDLLVGIARAAGAADPEVLGRQFLTLVEGSTVLADHHRDTRAAATARDAALALLRLQAPPRRA
jgi:AcrR family transcriptional regulator